MQIFIDQIEIWEPRKGLKNAQQVVCLIIHMIFTLKNVIYHFHAIYHFDIG